MLSKEQRLGKINKSTRFISETEVKYVVQRVKSNLEAAEYLKVSAGCWKKYANIYINPETSQSYYQDLKAHRRSNIIKRSNRFEDVIAGTIPVSTSQNKFKETLFAEGIFAEECMICGFNERRVTDFKTPLLLHFIDGNQKNGKIDNLEILCYNDYYLTVGNLPYQKLVDPNERNKHRKPVRSRS